MSHLRHFSAAALIGSCESGQGVHHHGNLSLHGNVIPVGHFRVPSPSSHLTAILHILLASKINKELQYKQR